MLAVACAYLPTVRRLIILASLVLAVACGSDSPSTASSTTTATTTPQRVQLGWHLDVDRDAHRRDRWRVSRWNDAGVGRRVNHRDDDIHAECSVDYGRFDSAGERVSCNWSGTADTDRFALNLSSCQSNANQFGLRCANGATRDLRIASSGITAVVGANGNYTGTKADTYNVVLAGTTTQVGTLVIAANVTMTK